MWRDESKFWTIDVMPKTIKKQAAKTIRSAAPKKTTRPAKKLSKKDPDYYSKIGAISARKRKMTSADFSAMAKASHPRKVYKGGRPKNPA